MTERIFYANQQISMRPDSEGDAAMGLGDELHGVQSVGMTTTFNLIQIFELGQLALYENSEDLPDVEVTISKVIDGYPLVWEHATIDAALPTLIGRSNAKCFVGMSIFNDTSVAEGAALSTVQCSGMYVSSLTFNFPLDDPFTEETTLVGNNKIWANAPSYGGTLDSSVTTPTVTQVGRFSSTVNDSPPSVSGVSRRQHLVLTDTNAYDRTQLPLEVAGVDPATSGVILTSSTRARLSSITVSSDFGRENLLELGRKAPYHRFVTFPTEVTCDIEVTATSGDFVSATEGGIYAGSSDNLANRIIRIATTDGLRVYLGNQNKLSSVSYGGGDAAGGNATATYSYSNFNDLTVLSETGAGINTSGAADAWWTNRVNFLQ